MTLAKIAFAVLCAGTALLTQLDLQNAGFPDGHLTEYDRRIGPVTQALVLFQVLLCIGVAFIGRLKPHEGKALAALVLLLLLAGGAHWAISEHYWQIYEHGQGG